MFGNLFMKAATWLVRRSLGSKQGAQVLAHASPVLTVITQAAGSAAQVAIDKAAQTNGSVAAAEALAGIAIGGN